MKNLIEIADIVTKKKVRKIEIFDDHSLKNKNSKFNEFYEALLAGKFKTDRDASTFLYDCAPTDDKYRQLKSRFRKRLLNTLFFLDVNAPSASNYDRAYFSCNKEWTLIKILELNEAYSTAADQAQQILTTALKFKFADIIVNCASLLRKYAADNGMEKEYEEYDQHVKQYANILDAEIRSEELYQRVYMNYYKSSEELQALIEKIDTYCDALVGLSEVYDSPVVIYNMYLVWIYRYEMTRDWAAMAEVCERAEKYVEENPTFYQDGKIATFQLKKMSAYLHLRDYKNGKNNVERFLQNFSDGSDMWFTFMEYYVLLALHTNNFINAFAVHARATSNTKFKKLSAETRERWYIYEVYLNFIAEAQGSASAVAQANKRKTFKVSKFLGESVMYPKEQRIFTVHLVTAQALFHLRRKDQQGATECIERLKIFANRQLNQEEYYRTIQFIRLLQQLPKADYKVTAMSNTEKYIARLTETPMFYRGMLQELEIIPYEKLWDLFVEQAQAL
jgi:hypothetical protein